MNKKSKPFLLGLLGAVVVVALIGLVAFWRAAVAFPPGYQGAGFTEQTSKGEPFVISCGAHPTRIILYLHTWSATYKQITMYPELGNLDDACAVSPNFNGRNNTPGACMSDDAVARIDRVVEKVQRKTGIKTVDLIGGSGGGYSSLVYLGRGRSAIRRASIWLPIYDLALWYFEAPTNDTYQTDLQGCFGRPPVDKTDAEYQARSPVKALNELPTSPSRNAQIVINVGTLDKDTPMHNGLDAKDQIARVCPTCSVKAITWQTGHVFNVPEAIKQIAQ